MGQRALPPKSAIIREIRRKIMSVHKCSSVVQNSIRICVHLRLPRRSLRRRRVHPRLKNRTARRGRLALPFAALRLGSMNLRFEI